MSPRAGMTVQGISEGCIMLASLIGYLHKTDLEGVYRFEHRLVTPACDLLSYQKYLTQRLEHFPAWPSSAGCDFEPVGDITPLPDGSGFGVLVRPRAAPASSHN